MAVILVGTYSGCRVFEAAGEGETELSDRQVSAVTAGVGGSCLAVVDETELWRRDVSGEWSHISTSGFAIQSLTYVGGDIFAGGMNEAAILRISHAGMAERLVGFDRMEGREEWFAGGPPLGVRALMATSDGSVILAAVHVGGIPRSSDRGETWRPTIPVMFDVHEVRGHCTAPGIVAAAASVGLCLSEDGGLNWTVIGEGFEEMTSLAVAVLEDEVLFSVQDSPFASQSQVWRYGLESGRVEQVRDGLPLWLDGKVDTGWITAGAGLAAIVDGGGSLWLSAEGSKGWKRICSDLTYAGGVAIMGD